MRTLHPSLSCPLCGLPYEHIKGTPAQLVLEGLFPQHLASEMRPGPRGEVEFLACQHGRATCGPALGLVPPRPVEVFKQDGSRREFSVDSEQAVQERRAAREREGPGA